jgi:hypothetical protein
VLINDGTADHLTESEVPTFGLPIEFHPAILWANRHAVWPQLHALIEVTLAVAAPQRNRGAILARIIDTVGHPLARSAFVSWSIHSRYADGLARLGQAMLADPAVLQTYPPAGFETRVHRQLDGLQAPLYLAGLCICRMPIRGNRLTEAHIEWYRTLVAWLLLHAHFAFFDKNVRQSVPLYRVCDRMRIAADDDLPEFVQLLHALAPPPEQIELLPRLDQTIAYRAESLLRIGGLKPKEVELLEAIRRVARHEHSEIVFDKTAFVLPAQAVESPVLAGYRAPPPVSFHSLDLDDEEIAPPGTAILDAPRLEDSATRIAATGLTEAYQRLTGRSILVATTESLHFLPWSWTSPTHQESEQLAGTAVKLLAAELLSDRFVGAVIFVGIQTGRSFKRTLEIDIAAKTSREWAVHLSDGRLVRQAPRRYSGWRPETVQEREWIRPAPMWQSFPIPHSVCAVLNEAVRSIPAVRCLGDLWSALSLGSPESKFASIMKDTCPRLRPGMIGRALCLGLHNATQDATFVKLATSHPQSALPGACAYASWSSVQVEGALAAALVDYESRPDLPGDDSLIGSLLVVLGTR